MYSIIVIISKVQELLYQIKCLILICISWVLCYLNFFEFFRVCILLTRLWNLETVSVFLDFKSEFQMRTVKRVVMGMKYTRQSKTVSFFGRWCLKNQTDIENIINWNTTHRLRKFISLPRQLKKTFEYLGRYIAIYGDTRVSVNDLFQ